jgi:hypothetical protein
LKEPRKTIGNAVDSCLKESTEEWYRQHAGMRSREVALAEDVRKISTTIEMEAGGKVRIFVGITTRKQHQHTHDWYRFQRSGTAGYVRVEPPNAKG